MLTAGDSHILGMLSDIHPMERAPTDWYVLACLHLKEVENGGVFRMSDDDVRLVQMYVSFALAADRVGAPPKS